MKTFPIQQDLRTRRPGFKIPWDLAEKAYKTYAELFGSDQSLDRLAERGGFGWEEFAVLYDGRNPARVRSGSEDMERCLEAVRYILRMEGVKIPKPRRRCHV